MRNTFVMVLLWILYETTAVYSQALESGSLANQATQEYKNRNHAQSEKLYKAALDSMNIDDLTRGAILRDLGNLYLEEERVAEAEQAYIKALKIFRRGTYSKETALLLRHLGSVYSIQRRHRDANKVLKEALKLANTYLPLDIALRVEILNSLGVSSFREGKTGKAEKFFKQGLDLCATAKGSLDAPLTSLLNNLGAIYFKKRDYLHAEALLTQSLNLTEMRYGPSHSALTYTLSTLGDLYVDLRRYADAEQQYKKAIAILEQNGLDFDVRLARALKELSDTYIIANKMAEAERTLQRAIPIARRSLTTHPDMAAILEAYSKLLGAVGKSKEAQQLYSEAQRARLTMTLTFRAYNPD